MDENKEIINADEVETLIGDVDLAPDIDETRIINEDGEVVDSDENIESEE